MHSKVAERRRGNEITHTLLLTFYSEKLSTINSVGVTPIPRTPQYSFIEVPFLVDGFCVD